MSRQDELASFLSYPWPSHWIGEGMASPGPIPVFVPPTAEELRALNLQKGRDDPHLRNTRHFMNYDIQAEDGKIGRVCGFLIEEGKWRIREVVVDAGPWYSDKEVLIPTEKVTGIDEHECIIAVSLTMAEIEGTAEHHVVKAGPMTD